MDLLKHINDNRYIGYSYSYPHKMAYRHLDEPIKISQAWEKENKHSVFLYLHIPFCEMRCSFCNLFTLPKPEEELINRYIEKLKVQAETIASELKSFTISRVAIGGGTPTILSLKQLTTIFELIKKHFKVDFSKVPCSIECSPATVSEEKIAFLKEIGVTRVSIGIQSFIEKEYRKMGRPDSIETVKNSLSMIRNARFPQFNIDLIYGYENQTAQSLNYSLNSMEEFNNNEVFLYPLYIRPLTACSKTMKQWSDNRIELYELARKTLGRNGFNQMSMRFFRKEEELKNTLPEYCCQQDGMIGLGAGARSYTKDLHYSFEYAVLRKSTEHIINTFCSLNPEDFSTIKYGIYLNMDEQKRRFVIKSLLHIGGLDCEFYFHLFKTNVLEDFPVIIELEKLELCSVSSTIRLTSRGIDYSDAIGPLFYSNSMKEKMNLFQLS